MTLLDSALALAGRSYRVFPVGNKKPAIKQHGKFYYELATTAPCTIKKWWAKHPNRNIGIAPGPNLIVFDPDNHAALELLAQEAGMTSTELLMSTRSVRTPGGGYHLYFRVIGPILFKNNRIPGLDVPIDIKGWGGFVVAPPSTSSKGTYVYINEIEPTVLPLSLLAFLRRLGRVKFEPQRPSVPAITPYTPFCPPAPPNASIHTTSVPAITPYTPFCPPAPPMLSEWITDKADQMLIMFPIHKHAGLNRDTQQGRLVAHLVRTNRRRGKEALYKVGCRWLFDQQDRFAESLPAAYAHLDRNLDRALSNEALAGPDQQHYVEEMRKQEIRTLPPGSHKLLTALMKIIFWKLLNTEDEDIKFTHKQLVMLSGMSERQVHIVKKQFLSWPMVKNGKKIREANTASVLRVLVEVEMGHHDKQGKAHPGRFLLDDDFLMLAFDPTREVPDESPF